MDKMNLMKKLFILFLFFTLTGCAAMPVSRDSEALDMEKILRLIEETSANKIRAFIGKTGGTAGKLDSISVASLSNNDLAIVFDVSGSVMYYYKFVSAATDSESDPQYIRPDDYSSSGVWYLMSGISLASSAIPQWNFRDSGCTDNDDNVRIYADCTDTGSGTEDCDITIAVQVDGTLTDVISIDADGNINFGGYAITNLSLSTPTITGVVDMGGATSVEIANSTSDMTLSTQGQVGFEVTDDQIVLHGGAVGEAQGEYAISTLVHLSASFDPSWAYDQESTYRSVPLFHVGDDFPEGFTIVEWKVAYVGGDPATELDADIICDTTPDYNTAAGATVMDVIDTSAGASSADSGFDSATCANGSNVYIHFGADPADDNVLITIDIWGYAEAD